MGWSSLIRTEDRFSSLIPLCSTVICDWWTLSHNHGSLGDDGGVRRMAAEGCKLGATKPGSNCLIFVTPGAHSVQCVRDQRQALPEVTRMAFCAVILRLCSTCKPTPRGVSTINSIASWPDGSCPLLTAIRSVIIYAGHPPLERTISNSSKDSSSPISFFFFFFFF